MDKVRYFKLENTGGFVAKIEIQYKARRVDDNGNVSYDADWHKWDTGGYRDICAGGERTVDLADAGFPDGSQVRLKAVVVWGKDKTGDVYLYQNNSNTMISYKISGTTQFNSLSRI